MARLQISVTVNNELLFLDNEDIHHKFTVAEVKAQAAESEIPVNGGTLYRNGQPVSDNDEVKDRDDFTVQFKKGKDGHQ